MVSPSLNSLGDDRPLSIALQIDDGEAQTSAFVPPATPGDLPDAWDGNDGWVANSIIEVPMVFPVQPGVHTLKVRVRCRKCTILKHSFVDTSGTGVDDRTDGRGAKNSDR